MGERRISFLSVALLGFLSLVGMQIKNAIVPMDEIGKIPLDGEDVCVCVGFCQEDAIPQWADKAAAA